MTDLTSCIAGFVATIVFVCLLRPLAHRVGLVDRPGGRKHHAGSVPLMGGLAMYGGFGVAVLTLSRHPPGAGVWLAAALLLLILGTVDDRFGLSYRVRFLLQAVAALLLIYLGDTTLHHLGYLFGHERVELGWFSTPFTIFAVAGVINAYNMSDGLDGLAGGVAVVALLAMAALCWGIGATQPLPYILALISTIIAFLVFNMRTPLRRQAEIFMGDGGSMFIGFALAWLFIVLSQQADGRPAAMAPVTALWLFALPLFDTVSVMLRRVFKGRSPFAPDREHFHHILLVAGYTPSQAVWIMLALASVLAAVGVVGYLVAVPEPVMFFGFLALFGLYVWAMSRAWKVMKLIKKAYNPSPLPTAPHDDMEGVLHTVELKGSEE